MIYICILLCAFIAPFSYTFGNEISSEIIEPPPVEVSIEDSIRKKGSNEISIHVTLNNTEREFILQTVDNFAGKNTKVWIAKKVNDKFVYTLQEDFMRKSNNITFFYNNQTESEVFQTVSENGESQFNSVINYDQVDNEPINVSNLSTVYPEILVYVDKTLFRHFDYDIEKTVIYTLTLWNGVDLDFRELQNPSVRLNIAGIVLCQDQPLGNDPFRVYSKKLDEFGKFMYNQDQFKLGKDYDIAVLLGADPLFNSGTAGRAFLGSTCVNNTYEQKIASTAIILDNTAFSGINTASHELGHLFGAPHDGEKDDSTAKHCSFYDGYIMSYTTIDEKQYYFSTCSKKIMSNYLRSEAPKCIRNNPLVNETNEQMLRILPGKFMTIDEQCQRQGYLRAYDVNPVSCKTIQCKRVEPGATAFSSIAALEGTPCYIGKYCLRGECVKVNFNTTENNKHSKELFPSLSQHPTFNKSATEQCIEMGIENVTNAYFENCQVKCKFPKEGFTYSMFIDAHYGTLCSNDGYCHKGKCIGMNNSEVTDIVVPDDSIPDSINHDNTYTMPDKYITADELCQKKGYIRAVDVNPDICQSINCLKETGYIIYTNMPALEGTPCYIGKYCLRGECVEATLNTTQSLSELPKFNKTAEEQCIEMGIENVTNAYFENCQVKCKFPKEGFTYYNIIDAYYGTSCGNDGYCHYGKCINVVKVTTPVVEEITDKSVPDVTDSNNTSSIMPNKFKSADEQCKEAGMLKFSNKTIKECILICEIEMDNNIDTNPYDSSSIKENIYDTSDIYKKVTAQDGFPCQENGYCQDGKCVNMTITDTNPSSTDFPLPEENSVGLPNDTTTPQSLTNFTDVKPLNDKITTPEVDVTTPKSIANDDSQIDDDKNNNDSPIFDASGLDDLIKALENDKCKADTSDDELPICEDNELSSNNLDGTNTSTIHNIITPDSNTGFHDVKSPNENITTPKVDVTTPKSISNDDSLIDDNNNNDSPIFDASGLDDLIKALENDNESSSNSLDELNKAIENDNKLSSKSLEDIIKMLENETCEADFSEDGCDNTTDLNSNTTFHNLVDSNNSTIHVSNPDNIQNSTDSTSSSDGLVAPLDGKTTPDSITIINNVESAENITTPFVEVTTPIVEITTPVVEVTTPVVEVPVQSTTDIDDRNIMPDNPKLYSFDKLAHEDCQKAGASGALKIYPTLCDMSCYKLPNNLTTNLTMNAPNGFPCTKGMYCQDGLCVNDDRESPVDLNKKPLLTEEGKLMLDNLACIEIGATSASKISTTDCVLHCKTTKMVKYDFMPKELYSHMYLNYNAPNGFPCGNNGICYNNTCIHQNQSKGKN